MFHEITTETVAVIEMLWNGKLNTLEHEHIMTALLIKTRNKIVNVFPTLTELLDSEATYKMYKN